MNASTELATTVEVALADFAPEVAVDPVALRLITLKPKSCLVVIDDDPTGSQSVSGIPVITHWQTADFDWAFDQGLGAVFVLLNTRAEDAATAKRLNTEAVNNAIESANAKGITVSFVSRGDSTLRGHFPQEIDAITETLAAAGRKPNSATLMVPAFPRAGRVTLNGVHYLREGETLTPVGQTEFAKDSSFGFTQSNIGKYVEEKTLGSIKASEVGNINLNVIRSTPEAICQALLSLPFGSVASVDAFTENDLRMLALGIALAQEQGASYLYRTGPSFVGAWVGQQDYAPLEPSELGSLTEQRQAGGLIVIGSHVDLTNRQLAQVREAYPSLLEVEITPEIAMDNAFSTGQSQLIATSISKSLDSQNVILRTSRKVATGLTAEDSLAIARRVSDSVAEVVNLVLRQNRPKFVIAKGGITSNDVASKGLEVRHAIVVGPLLPGLVSLWRPEDGVAVGVPFVVFPGNVGDEFALAQIIDKLSTKTSESSKA